MELQGAGLNKRGNSGFCAVSGVYYHIVAFACEKDSNARFLFLPSHWPTGASVLHCRKAPLLGVREPSHGYLQRAQYVKRLLLAALAMKTNRGRGAHNKSQ